MTLYTGFYGLMGLCVSHVVFIWYSFILTGILSERLVYKNDKQIIHTHTHTLDIIFTLRKATSVIANHSLWEIALLQSQ